MTNENAKINTDISPAQEVMDRLHTMQSFSNHLSVTLEERLGCIMYPQSPKVKEPASPETVKVFPPLFEDIINILTAIYEDLNSISNTMDRVRL